MPAALAKFVGGDMAFLVAECLGQIGVMWLPSKQIRTEDELDPKAAVETKHALTPYRKAVKRWCLENLRCR